MPVSRTPPLDDPVEFSVEDAILNTWNEEAGEYLRLDPPERPPIEPQVPEQS